MITRREIRIEPLAHKVNTLNFVEIGNYILIQNESNPEFMAIKNFDLPTLKSLDLINIRKLAKNKVKSILIEYKINKNKSRFALHSLESFLINIDAIDRKSKCDLVFYVNDNMVKHFNAKILCI
jgi:hypothetical protein